MEGSEDEGETKGLNSCIIMYYNMPQLFKAKVRKVGTSFGILIPNDFMKKEKIKEGEILSFTALRQRRIDEVLKLFGTAKGAKPFERDKTDRVDRW